MSNRLIVLLFAFGLLGCGGGGQDLSGGQTLLYDLHDDSSSVAVDFKSSEITRAMGSESGDTGIETAVEGGRQSIPPTTPVTDDRKIIYTATIDLIVANLPSVDEQIKKLMNENGGYLAEYREDRSYGDQLQGHWIVRIPASKFHGFVDAIDDLGVPQSRQINAQEVTVQHRDLDARLKNKRRTEEQLLKLLDERSSKVEDVVQIAVQLDNVREAIERMEAELRGLENRIAMTTVTVSAREQKDYTPPQAPGFGTRIADTFGGSLSSLAAFGQGTVLVFVAIIPWLAILLLIVVPYGLFAARRRR